MACGPKPQYPDAIVERCLLAQSPEEIVAICAETGLSRSMADHWRSRLTKRAVLIAARIGLPPLSRPPPPSRPETSLDIFRRAVRR